VQPRHKDGGGEDLSKKMKVQEGRPLLTFFIEYEKKGII
jgi:hypothetical protein